MRVSSSNKAFVDFERFGIQAFTIRLEEFLRLEVPPLETMLFLLLSDRPLDCDLEGMFGTSILLDRLEILHRASQIGRSSAGFQPTWDGLEDNKAAKSVGTFDN